MLSQKYRFHSRGGVRFVYKNGKTIRTAKMSLVHMPNSRGYQRFAVVVSKKVEKTAVGRNKMRRRIYEALRIYKATHQLDIPQDFIFVVYSKEFLSCDFKEIVSTVGSLIEQSIMV